MTAPHGTGPRRGGSIGTTRPGVLAAIAVVAVAAGWTAIRVLTSLAGELPDVPRSAPWALAFLAGILVAGARMMRRRVQRWTPGRERVDPELAVRLLVLAKASAIAGSAVLGGYVGAALYYAGALDVPFRQTATWWSLGSALAALVVVGCALWLERECRIPPGQDRDQA